MTTTAWRLARQGQVEQHLPELEESPHKHQKRGEGRGGGILLAMAARAASDAELCNLKSTE
jgi:hypothetical protein